ncbi:MAG: hypothetical protein EZS28_004922 [Streblomastix strix]|uniref:UBA domain-containing protein n=1 Tax=Streblomastix strix TaxID=222440 RepID=A0A5J4WYJ7_9EUKA|nr:MAG: hypothetical protein EZS28_004922 [Streblomastix strix]
MSQRSSNRFKLDPEAVEQLLSLDQFPIQNVEQALRTANGDINIAASLLIDDEINQIGKPIKRGRRNFNNELNKRDEEDQNDSMRNRRRNSRKRTRYNDDVQQADNLSVALQQTIFNEQIQVLQSSTNSTPIVLAQLDPESVNNIIDMEFSKETVEQALIAANGNKNMAASYLLDEARINQIRI